MTSPEPNAAPKPEGNSESEVGVLSRAVPEQTKTPFYQAIHAARYQRKAIIDEIQRRTGRKFISYVAGPEAIVERDDTIGFVDLLHNVPQEQNLDFLLHTVGGDIDAAEKLITMVRARVGDASLRIIVPDYAKSAGTLMVLGANAVVMSDSSELGPIDPQFECVDERGCRRWHSILSYLDAYEEYSRMLKSDPENVSAQIMLRKLDPATVIHFRAVRSRAQTFAEQQLLRGMFKRQAGNYSMVASVLLDKNRWFSHGKMISWRDAIEIGLIVDYRGADDSEWQAWWQLYCLQRLAVSGRNKLYESDYVSVLIEGSSS